MYDLKGIEENMEIYYRAWIVAMINISIWHKKLIDVFALEPYQKVQSAMILHQLFSFQLFAKRQTEIH